MFAEKWHTYFKDKRAEFDAYYDKCKRWDDELASPIEAELNELLEDHFSHNPHH